MSISSDQFFNAATTVLPLLSGVLVGQALNKARGFNEEAGISLGTVTNLALGVFAASFSSLVRYNESPSIENTVFKIALFAVPILFLCLNRTQVTALEAKEVTVSAGKPLECEKLFKKAKRAEVHHTPQIIALEPKKATVVEKPSVAPAILAQLPEKENGEVKIRQAAMAVAKGVEQLSESLPAKYDEAFEKQVLEVINGQGSAEEKDERILALVNARKL